MKSVVEPLEGNKVKVRIELDDAEFTTALDEAWGTIAKEASLPGFRKGKVPKQVVKSRVDASFARGEAIQTAVPRAYEDAIRNTRSMRSISLTSNSMRVPRKAR
ncbi:MAG: trigger factor family protein [Candidatus Microthrix sp.]|nr:trigger factor family protein [Candidatus Microthrix sp.]MBK6503408.1 trigger factor family protein [Candidatus Microthrix sp.]